MERIKKALGGMMDDHGYDGTHHGQVIKLLKEHFGEHDIVGVEIGTRAGDLTKAILWARPNCRLYTVDPWIFVEKNAFEAGHPQAEHDEVKAHALNALKEFGSRVLIMPMTSDEAFKEIQYPVDFVWIDGDHTISTVERDIENGLRLVRTGGILGGHDHNTVFEAIKKTLPGREIIQGSDQTWWVFI